MAVALEAGLAVIREALILPANIQRTTARRITDRVTAAVRITEEVLMVVADMAVVTGAEAVLVADIINLLSGRGCRQKQTKQAQPAPIDRLPYGAFVSSGKTRAGWRSRKARVPGPKLIRSPLSSTPFELQPMAPCQPC
jgi:hypothetical protein